MKKFNHFLIKTCLTLIVFSLLGYSLKLLLIQFNQSHYQPLNTLTQKPTYSERHLSPSPQKIEPVQQQYITPSLSDVTNTFKIYLPSIYAYTNFKKGLGAANPPACLDMEALDATWYYNWDIYPDPSCKQPDTQFIPMLYDANHMVEPYFSEAIKNAQVSGWIMGFNEPNLTWVGNVTPEEGAIYWKYLEDVAVPRNIKLISPAPNPWDPGTVDPDHNMYGNQWLWAMVDAYQKQNQGRKPRFDAFSWHMYEIDPNKIIDFLTKRHDEALARGYDVPFWVTEYSAFCTYSATQDRPFNRQIMLSVTPWLNQTEWIERYAWFANRLPNDGSSLGRWHSCSLVNPETNELTPIGQIYKDF